MKKRIFCLLLAPLFALAAAAETLAGTPNDVEADFDFDAEFEADFDVPADEENGVPAPIFEKDERPIIVLGFLSNPDETQKFVEKTHAGTKIEFYCWKSNPKTLEIWDALPEKVEKIEVSENDAVSQLLKDFAAAMARGAAETMKFAEKWARAKENADAEVDNLAAEILAFPRKEREKIVLVGHSLGGRMVVKTLARLAQKNAKIKRAILMGAAIDVRDPAIKIATNATISGIENRYNRDDYVLNLGYGNAGELVLRTLEFIFEDGETLQTTALGTTDVDFVPAGWTNLRIDVPAIDNHVFEYYWNGGNENSENADFDD